MAERGNVVDRRRRPWPGRYPIAQGEAELLADANRDGGWMLSVGGVPQSYVDLTDPTYLDFEYMQLMGDIVDCIRVAGEPIDAVHIGGAGCTLPRYVAATRPRSRQLVYEPDAALVQLVRDHLSLKRVPGLKVRVTDGRGGVAALPTDVDDLLVLDAFAEASMPPELASVEFAGEAARVLRPDGVYMVNVPDGAGLAFARRMVATVRAVFAHTLLLAEPGVLRGRRFGNLLLVGSPTDLPYAELTRRAAGGLVRARCVHGADLDRFRGGAAPLYDGEEIPLPAPPRAVFGR